MPLLTGAIVIWSGSVASIPAGWQLCNGTNGTPDLRDRFIVGAGDLYAVNATGGQTDGILVAHNHSGSAATVGSHGHELPNVGDYSGNYTGNSLRQQFSSQGTATSTSSGSHTHNSVTTGAVTGLTTGSMTNANMPPYFALAYIQQIS